MAPFVKSNTRESRNALVPLAGNCWTILFPVPIVATSNPAFLTVSCALANAALVTAGTSAVLVSHRAIRGCVQSPLHHRLEDACQD